MVHEMGMDKMDILDIGGGFSMNSPVKSNNFTTVAPMIHAYMEEKKKDFPTDVELIGEPGRFISEEAMTLLVRVI
jgi:diaminopimelate decarboxylase